MRHHFVEGGVRVLGQLEADDLHLVELVQAVQAAYVLSVRTGLAAPAGRIGRHLHGEVFPLQDHVAVDIGHRHFGRRNHVETVERCVVHLAFLVGQLTGTETGVSVDHVRRLVFEIAGVGVLLEEPGDECALDLGALALIDGESGSGEFHTKVEVDDIEVLDQFPVRQRIFRKVRFGTAHLDDDIVFGSASFGDLRIRQVRQQHDQRLLFLFGLGHLLFEGLGFFLQLGDGRLGCIGCIAQALFHQAADLGRLGFLLGQAGIKLRLGRTALTVYIEDFIDNFLCIEMLDLQAFDDEFRFLAEEFEG